MRRWGQLVGSGAVAAGSVAVLAKSRNGAVDAGDGILLVGALVVFARTAIGLASESPARRQNGERR